MVWVNQSSIITGETGRSSESVQIVGVIESFLRYQQQQQVAVYDEIEID